MHSPRNLVVFEFLGTAVILFGALLGTILIPNTGYNWITPPFVGVAIALTFHKSGAHLNPAVTALVNSFPRSHRIQNFAYVATQVATAVAIGLIFRWVLIAQNVPVGSTEFKPFDSSTIFLEVGATFILMSLIAVLALNGKAIWTIVAVPAMLYLLALSPLFIDQMNPAVTIAQTIEGLLTPLQLLEHLIGEALGVSLVITWVLVWVKRKRPASKS